jgi:hypothetical protein
MEEVMNQAPEHISKEDAEIIFKKNKENVIDTLIELWELEVPKSVPSQSAEDIDKTDEVVEDILTNDKAVLSSDKAKWANIRDICDSYDIEMQTQMNRMKNR